VGIALVLALIGGGFLWWRHHQQAPAPAPAPVAPMPKPAPAPAPAPAAAPGIQHPLEPAPKQGLPALDESDAYVKNALTELLGKKGLLGLVLDGFVRRVVSTVDNLSTEHAPSDRWPVNPTPGRFEAEPAGGGTVIAARNADRYTPFVRFAEGIDTRKAVALYVRLYPLLQQAYDDLGYGGKYFNDRVVEVIDHLLATPDPAGPIKVKLIEAKTPGGTARTLYQYEDSTLEARSSGQKILLRMGRENADKLKAKLVEVRRQITRGPGRKLEK
jgi:hypothetical protein